MSSLSISETGLALIQRYEGFSAEPKQLPSGDWVVGFGHVRAEAGEAVTREAAAGLLAFDVAPFELCVNEAIKAEITQTQFDALVSFAYSVGAEAFAKSAVVRKINAGQIMAAACELDAWRKCDVAGEVQVLDVLVARRAAEKAMLLADFEAGPSPSAFVRAKLDHAASILGSSSTAKAAPELGSILPEPAKPETATALVAVLQSEPATHALLLTQVVSDEAVEEGGDEITTGHAKPKARALEPSLAMARQAIDRAIEETDTRKARGFSFNGAFENVGLFALFAFGLVLMVAGISILTRWHLDMADVAGAMALCAPGLAAMLMAGFAWRQPRVSRVRARR